MLYKRQGLPEINEIVFCKVTKLFPNAVFVELLEYGDSGIVHISEISPGRIRNLREFVSIDRQIVCKVLRIDHINKHIDLSLRRVNSTERQQKLEEIKLENNSEILLRNISKKVQKTFEQLYNEVAPKIFKEYLFLHLAFKDVVDGKLNLEKLGIDKKIAQEITSAVIEKFKPQKIVVKGTITLQTYAPNGIEKIKTTLHEIEKVTPTLRLTYLGAGRFKIEVEDIDYKPAEKHFHKIEEIIEKFIDKLSTAAIVREKAEEV